MRGFSPRSPNLCTGNEFYNDFFETNRCSLSVPVVFKGLDRKDSATPQYCRNSVGSNSFLRFQFDSTLTPKSTEKDFAAEWEAVEYWNAPISELGSNIESFRKLSDCKDIDHLNILNQCLTLTLLH